MIWNILNLESQIDHKNETSQNIEIDHENETSQNIAIDNENSFDEKKVVKKTEKTSPSKQFGTILKKTLQGIKNNDVECITDVIDIIDQIESD